MSNETASPLFNSFVSSLAWMVEIKNHSGFKGGIDQNYNFGEYLPYYADYSNEVVFHIPSYWPSNPVNRDEQQVFINN